MKTNIIKMEEGFFWLRSSSALPLPLLFMMFGWLEEIFSLFDHRTVFNE